MNVLASLLFLYNLYPDLKLRVVAKLVNRTIDDEGGDSVTGIVPTYTPNEGDPWIQGNVCSFCDVGRNVIDINRTFNGTWHDATYKSRRDPASSSGLVIAFNFTGTAVYVYNLVANRVLIPGTTTFTNLTFHIDGEHVGQFVHVPDETTDVLYRVPVYSNASLVYKTHSMEIRAGGTNPSLVLFDYAEYTTDEEDGSLSKIPSETVPLSQPTTFAHASFQSVSPALTLSASSSHTSQSVPPTEKSPERSPKSNTSAVEIALGTGCALLVVAFTLFGALYLIRKRRKIRVKASIHRSFSPFSLSEASDAQKR